MGLPNSYEFGYFAGSIGELICEVPFGFPLSGSWFCLKVSGLHQARALAWRGHEDRIFR